MLRAACFAAVLAALPEAHSLGHRSALGLRPQSRTALSSPHSSARRCPRLSTLFTDRVERDNQRPERVDASDGSSIASPGRTEEGTAATALPDAHAAPSLASAHVAPSNDAREGREGRSFYGLGQKRSAPVPDTAAHAASPALPSSFSASPAASGPFATTAAAFQTGARAGFPPTATLLAPPAPSSSAAPASNASPALVRELTEVRLRVERLEKAIAERSLLSRGGIGGVGFGAAGGGMGVRRSSTVQSFESLVDTISVNYLAMSSRSVEVMATLSFFVIGVIVGASLLDRLWLLSGAAAAYWASGAVHRDSRGGALCRRVGVQVTQLVRDVQEKCMQALLFYRTGQLAYVSQLEWERYDQQFRLSARSERVRGLLQRARKEVGQRWGQVERRLELGRRAGQGWGGLVRAWGQISGAAEGDRGEWGTDGGRRRQPTGAYTAADLLLRPLSLLRRSQQALSRRLLPPARSALNSAAAAAARVAAAAGGVSRQAGGPDGQSWRRSLATALGLPPSSVSGLGVLGEYEWRYWGVVQEWARGSRRRTLELLGVRERSRKVNIWGGPFGAYVVAGQRRGDKGAVERVLGWVGFDRRRRGRRARA